LEKKEMETTNMGKTRMLMLSLILVFCSVVTMQVLAKDQSEHIVKPSSTGWQHLALTHTVGDTPERELGQNINKLGRDGWELVSVGNITKSGTTTQTIFYIKKPL
jgi:hypothetical protein